MNRALHLIVIIKYDLTKKKMETEERLENCNESSEGIGLHAVQFNSR